MRREEAETARARLLELFPLGFEEVERADAVELAVYGDEDELQPFAAAFPSAAVRAVEPGWEEQWKRFHRPSVVGSLWIGPPWLVPPEGLTAVVIDPGRAFGTGGHATTRLCLDLLLTLAPGSLLDIGCGSGVLAIAAAKLGFEPVRAFDTDPHAVEATERNAAANGVEVALAELDARVDSLPAADVAVANIALDVVEAIGRRIDVAVALTSGYLASERPSLPGFTPFDRREADGWAADAFRRER